ncbi:hypothetical protein Sgri01_07173 [Streptomyces griseus]
MLHPVRSRPETSTSDLTRHRRDNRYPRRFKGQAGYLPGELLQHRIHQRRVERVTHRQPAGPHTLSDQTVHHTTDSTLLTRQDHRPRRVHRGNPHPRNPHNPFPDHLLRGSNRHHHPTRRNLLHQPTTHTHQPHRVSQTQHTRSHRRTDLTDRMPHQNIRPNTTLHQNPPQPHLQRDQPHLREHRPVDQPTPATLTEQHRTQRLRQQPVRHRTHLVHHTGEHPEPPIQLHTHTGKLRTLPREQHRRLPTHRRPTHHTVNRPTLSQHIQPSNKISDTLTHHHSTVLQHRTAHQHRSHTRDINVLITTPYELRKPRRLPPQARIPTPGHQPRHRAGVVGRGLGERCDRGRLLQDHVRVRSADPERGHPSPARAALCPPRDRLGQQTHLTRRPVHVRRRLIHMQRLRKQPVPHRHHHLDDPGHTRRRLRMPDVRLHRPQPQRTPLHPVLAVRRQQRLRLDRITQARTRTVRLDDIHVTRSQAGVGEGLPDHALLRGAVGRRQTVRRTVLIHRGSTQHPEHPVTVRHRCGKPLQQQDTRALAPARTVGPRSERLAPSVGRQAPLAAELHERTRRRHHGHTTGDRQRAFAGTQRLHRHVQRHQRRRTRRVHRHRRTLQPEHIRETARHHTRRVPGRQVPLGGDPGAAQQGDVVLAVGADEDTGRAGAQGLRCDVRTLQRLPGHLKEQPLLRVHGQRLTRIDAEELGVELVDVVQEAAGGGIAGSRAVRVVVEEGRQVPAPVGREVGQSVVARRDQPPEVLGRTHVAGVPAAHPDDGDGVVVHRCAGRRRKRGDGGGGSAEQLRPKMRGEHPWCGVVEQQGGREAQAGGGAETIADFDSGQRVAAEVAESPVLVDVRRSGVAQHLGRRRADHVE